MVSSHHNLILAAAVAAGCIVSLFVSKYTLPDNNNNHDHRLLIQHSDPKSLTVRRVVPGWDNQGQALYQNRIHMLERFRINEGRTHSHQWHGPKNNGGLFFVTPMNQNKHFWDDLNDLDTSVNTFHILDKLVNPGETIVADIGTWIGPSLLYHGQFSARSFGIEADPDAFAIVERNVELNRELNPAWGNKVSVDAGCISRPEDVGKVTMKSGRKPGMSNSGIGKLVARLKSSNAATWQVQCYSLPDIFDNYWGIQKPYFDVMIMIDIESYECKLVPSFFDWLKDETHLPKMLMNFHPIIDRCSHEDYEGVLRFLRLYDHVTIGSSQREIDIQMATVEDFKRMDNYFTIVAFQDHHAVDASTALAIAGQSIIPDTSKLAQSNVDVSSFWLNDVDYNQKWQNGRYKCFFLGLSDPTNGYLIWDRRHQGLRYSNQAYQYATRLESEFNIRHFFKSPPFQTQLPGQFMAQLTDDAKQRFLGANSVIVQPSHTAPAGSIIFKCTEARMYNTLNHVIEGGSKGFEQTLLKELADTILLVEAYPRLVYDFQFMIDLEGQIYHLDFDRMLRTMTPGTGVIKTCLEDAMAYMRNSMNQS